MGEKLKPCPCCGFETPISEINILLGTMSALYYVTCPKCGASSRPLRADLIGYTHDKGEKEAADTWNELCTYAEGVRNDAEEN